MNGIPIRTSNVAKMNEAMLVRQGSGNLICVCKGGSVDVWVS